MCSLPPHPNGPFAGRPENPGDGGVLIRHLSLTIVVLEIAAKERSVLNMSMNLRETWNRTAGRAMILIKADDT